MMPTRLLHDTLRDSRELATLAVPLIMTQLAQVALTTTDVVMIGRLGTEALASGGLAMVVFNQLRTMGVGLLTATGNQVAAASTRPDPEETVSDLVRAAMAIAVLAGVVGAIVMTVGSRGLVWLGQDPTVVSRAQPLLVALAPGLVPCLLFQAIRQYTVGMRRPLALMNITLGSILVNVGLNLALMTGIGFFPELGLVGIGISTTTVYSLSFLVFLAAVRRDVQLSPMLSLKGWQASPAALKKLARLGFPISATYGSEAGFFLVVALLIGSFSAAALAAHTVVNQIVYTVFMITVGLSHAGSILVSREVAMDGWAAAARVRRTTLLIGFAVMATLAIPYLWTPGTVLRLFLEPGQADSEAVLALATQLLAVAAVLQVFDCWQNIGVGLLRALEDTAGGFRMTLVGYWGVGLPAAWLIGRGAGLGPRGVWFGLAIGLAATSGLLLHRFARRLARTAGRSFSQA
jgi:multidrug resistance protein, MATE family